MYMSHQKEVTLGILISIVLVNIFLYYTPSQFYLVHRHHFSCKHALANSVDHMTLSEFKPADLDLQCFHKRINPCLAGQGLIDKHCVY